MKKDTLDSLLSIFEYFSDQVDNTATFSGFIKSSTWDDITTSISRIFTIDIIINDIQINKSPILFPVDNGTYAVLPVNKLREDIINRKILDVIKIEFNMFYPNITSMLVEEGLLTDNKTYILYSILKYYIELKKHLSKNGRKCVKIYMNYFFGKLSKDEKSMIIDRASKILDHLCKYDGWLYTDTDIVYIKDSIGIIDKIKEDIGNILQLPYEITYIKEFLTLGNKKVVTIDEHSIGKIYGVPIKKL